MSKKFFFIGTLALLGASLFLLGCPTEAETETVYVPGDVINPDVVVDISSDDSDLLTALANPAFKVIEVVPGGTLTTVTEIPAGKTVILQGSVTPAGAGLTINGTVNVGVAGTLVAAASTKVIVKGGVLNVAKGILSIDAAASVDNGNADSPGTALGTGKVPIAGGTLKFTAAADVADADKIVKALGYVSSGTLDIGTSGLKPSELAVVTGISATKGLKATSSAADSATDTALTIPAGADITAAAGDTFAAIPSLTVNGKLAASGAIFTAATSVTVSGTLDIGTNAALTLAGLDGSGTKVITTSGAGVVKSATTTANTLQALLGKAGTALNIEQTGAVTLGAAATVKAGTVLTIGASGKVTAESGSTDKSLTVAGKVVLDGGSLVTAGTHSDNADITISGTGSVTAGGIVISGAGGVNADTAGVTLTANDLTLAASTTLLITGSAQIQAGGANGVTFKAGSYVFGTNETTSVLAVAAGKGILSLSANADALAIGDTVASELVFGSGSVYKAGSDSTTVTPGTTTTASANVKLTFKAGAQIVSGTGATAQTSGVALKATGDANANNSTYTVGTDTTVTKTAAAKTWSGTVSAGT